MDSTEYFLPLSPPPLFPTETEIEQTVYFPLKQIPKVLLIEKKTITCKSKKMRYAIHKLIAN